jgi:hypothetical protein
MVWRIDARPAGPAPFDHRVADGSAAIGLAPFERRVAQRDEQLRQAGPHFVDLADLEPADVDDAFEELARRKRQDPNLHQWVRRMSG